MRVRQPTATRRSQCPTNQICDRRANKCIENPGCFSDEFCEAGEICDVVNRVCRTLSVECASCILGADQCTGSTFCFENTKECLPSGVEATCRPGEKCDPLGRCVQCTDSGECGPGLFCNTAIGRCESNVQCADDPSLCPDSGDVTCIQCEAPEICDPRTRTCQAPPMTCESEVDCPGDEFCDLSLEPPICRPLVPDCLNDAFDDPEGDGGPNENDLVATASLLEEGDGPDYQDLRICPGDQDWYRIEVQAGSYLTVDARFEHDLGDAELQLYLSDGVTLVDESRSTTDNERVELEVGTDLTLLVRVFLALPTVQPLDYRLIVTRDPGAVCADDGNEPDDGPSSASALVSDTPYEGRLCAADPDWFVLRNVPPATQIVGTLEFADSLGDLDLELYRAGSLTPILRAASLDDNETLTYDASYGGDFFLRVVGKAADTNVYTIRANLRENAAAACLDDGLEPNGINEPSDGNQIFGMESELTLCAGDEDWFLIPLDPGDGLTAEIGFQPQADLDLRLYPSGTTDPDVTPLKLAAGTTPREYLAYRATQSEDLLLRVHGHTDGEITPYTLNLDKVPPFVCEPDEFDAMGRGNSQMDTVLMDIAFPPIDKVRLDDVTICAGDEDWITIFLPAGFQNVLRLQYIADDASLDFELYQGQTVLWPPLGFPGFPPGDVKELFIPVPGNGGFASVDMRVFLESGFETAYSVTLDLVPIFNCQPDVAEPNNRSTNPSMAASSSITPTTLDLTMCTSTADPFTGGGDEDWFILNPPFAGAVIDASLTHNTGDLLMELFSPGVAPTLVRACPNIPPNRCFSDGLGLSEQITFTATTTEPYFLRVSSVWSAPGLPAAPPDADTAYTLDVRYSGP